MLANFKHEDWTKLVSVLNGQTPPASYDYDNYLAMLILARNRLVWLAEQTCCMSCQHFEMGRCQKAGGKLPPEEVQRKGCEMHDNKFTIPF